MQQISFIGNAKQAVLCISGIGSWGLVFKQICSAIVYVHHSCDTEIACNIVSGMRIDQSVHPCIVIDGMSRTSASPCIQIINACSHIDHIVIFIQIIYLTDELSSRHRIDRNIRSICRHACPRCYLFFCQTETFHIGCYGIRRLDL